ncbi:hypothetical protein [uncultured Secundilactobacillus sp.]|uniref:hypothetical protein n=1 Tax=uncultured Secundilactobacillus sp. TaxID=2813935 RepID=UPI002586B53E|nr:hypothetical protein [uncultured Secundilactobacillus sp.]
MTKNNVEFYLNDQDLTQVTGGSIVGNFLGDVVYWGTRGVLSQNKLRAKQMHIHVGY